MKEGSKLVFKDKKFKNFLIRMEQNLFCENVTVDGQTRTRILEGNLFSSTNLVRIGSAFIRMFGSHTAFTKSMYNNNDGKYRPFEKLGAMWPGLQTAGWQYRVISPKQIALYFKCEVPRKLLESKIGKHFSMENWSFRDGETGMRVWHCDPFEYKCRVIIPVPESKVGEDYLPRTDKKSIGHDIMYKDTRKENAKTLDEMSKKEDVRQDVFDIDLEKVLPGFAELQKLDRVRSNKAVNVKTAKQLVAQAQAQLDMAIAEQQQADAEYHEVMLTLQPKITIMTQILDKYSFKEA